MTNAARHTALTARRIKDEAGRFLCWAIFVGDMLVPRFWLDVTEDGLVPRFEWEGDELNGYLMELYSPYTDEFRSQVLPSIRGTMEAKWKNDEAEAKAEAETERRVEQFFEQGPDDGFDEWEASRGVIQFSDAMDMAYGRV